jgi:hypothetical protein
VRLLLVLISARAFKNKKKHALRNILLQRVKQHAPENPAPGRNPGLTNTQKDTVFKIYYKMFCHAML